MVQVTKKLLRGVEKVSYVYGPLDSNPLKMLKHFFESNTLEEFTERLKAWYGKTYLPFTGKSEKVIDALTTHQMACQLVNVSWLLSKVSKKELAASINVGTHGFNLIGPACYSRMNEEVVAILDDLTFVFRTMQPQLFHRLLYRWLNDSFLENRSSEQVFNNHELYNALLKIARHCAVIYDFLICERSSSKCVETDTKTVSPTATVTDLNRELGDAALNLFDTTSPIQLNRSLRKLLVDYLLFNASGIPSDLNQVVDDYYWLCDFIDLAADKLHKPE